MTTFVDTSALYALLDRDDRNHAAAAGAFPSLLEEGLLTHSYVVVETSALVHRRLGPAATRALMEDLLSPLELVFVDADVHRAAVSAFLAAVRRRVSLVDWVSFELMRRLGIDRAFAFDADFQVQGFPTVP